MLEELQSNETWGQNKSKLNKAIRHGTPAATVQLFFIGDSITHGIGTTGTTSGVMGANTYPKQAIARLGITAAQTVIKGYSGQRAKWFTDNKLAETIEQFDFDAYDEVVCVVFFGANDLPSYSVAQVYQDLIEVHTLLRAAGAKTVTVPVMRRADQYATPQMTAKRVELNKLLRANWASFSDEYATLENQPYIFSDLAPENSTYFAVNDVDNLSKVHPTDAGAALIAEEVAQAVARLNKLHLPYNAKTAYPSILGERTPLQTIYFPEVQGLQFSEANDAYTTVTGTGTAFGNTGVNKRLRIAAGQEGFIQMRFTATDGKYAMMGLKSTNTLQTYAFFNFCTYGWPAASELAIFESNVQVGKNGTAGFATGSYVRLLRLISVVNGTMTGTVKAQHSTDGILWTDYHTFTSTYTGELYPVCDLRGDGKMYSLKGYNLTSV